MSFSSFYSVWNFEHTHKQNQKQNRKPMFLRPSDFNLILFILPFVEPKTPQAHSRRSLYIYVSISSLVITIVCAVNTDSYMKLSQQWEMTTQRKARFEKCQLPTPSNSPCICVLPLITLFFSFLLWSFHGPKRWSRSGSISRPKLRTFKQMMSFTEVIGQFSHDFNLIWGSGIGNLRFSKAQKQN